MADRYEHGQGGPIRWFRDFSSLLGRPLSQVFCEVVDVVDRAARELGRVTVASGTITVGSPVTISGEVTISGPVTITGSGLTGGDIDANMYVDGYPVDNTNPVYTADTWSPTTVSDTALNDSAKSLPVPSGYEYHVLWVWAELTSDTAEGARQLELRVHDSSGDIIFQMRAGATQQASESRYYAFGPDLTDLTAFRDTNYLMGPIPATLYLPAGYSVQVLDNNAVSVTGDDLIIHMQVRRRPA